MFNDSNFDHYQHATLCRPSRNLAECTTVGVGIPDYDRALLQQQDLEKALAKCGVTLTTLPADRLFPDRCFMAESVVVTEHLAVLSNFATSPKRQGEQKAAASQLVASKFLKFIAAPGSLHAADVLQINDQFYIGLTPDTNQEGAAQLAFYLMESGYTATILDMAGYKNMRLKYAATYLGAGRLLLRTELAQHFAFLGFDKILVPAAERGAAAALVINGQVLLPQGYPETLALLQKAKLRVREVNVSEFEKMGGTLKSLVMLEPTMAAKATIELPRRIEAAVA